MADTWAGSWGAIWGVSWTRGSTPPAPSPATIPGGFPLTLKEWARRRPKEDEDPGPIVVERIGNVTPDVPQPPIIRSAPGLRAALEAAKAATNSLFNEGIRELSRRAAKKRRRLRDDDDWLMMN